MPEGGRKGIELTKKRAGQQDAMAINMVAKIADETLKATKDAEVNSRILDALNDEISRAEKQADRWAMKAQALREVRSKFTLPSDKSWTVTYASAK